VSDQVLSLDTDQTAIARAALLAGEPIIVVGPPSGTNRGRGFILYSAALASEATVNFSVTHGRGLTCFSVSAERAMQLGLVLSGEYREGYRGPIFLRSVEAAECDGTGISAADRAMTLRAAGAPDAGVTSLKSPGHVMPVLVGYRGGETQTPAELALLTIRRLTSGDVAAWTDILDDDGDVADADYCTALAHRLAVPCIEAAEDLPSA